MGLVISDICSTNYYNVLFLYKNIDAYNSQGSQLVFFDIHISFKQYFFGSLKCCSLRAKHKNTKNLSKK